MKLMTEAQMLEKFPTLPKPRDRNPDCPHCNGWGRFWQRHTSGCGALEYGYAIVPCDCTAAGRRYWNKIKARNP